MKYIFLFLMSSMLMIPVASMESRKKNVASSRIPKETRDRLQNIWTKERKERISYTTTALSLSFGASYLFGVAKVAGYFNWVNESIAAYSKLFFNISIASAAATWYYHNERNIVIKKTRLSEHELYAAYMASQAEAAKKRVSQI